MRSEGICNNCSILTRAMIVNSLKIYLLSLDGDCKETQEWDVAFDAKRSRCLLPIKRTVVMDV